MNIEEYKKEVKRIDREANEEKKILARKYAMERNNINIGDTVTGSYCSIIVDVIKVGINHGLDIPECVYHGPKLTKKGKPYANGDMANVWESDIK